MNPKKFQEISALADTVRDSLELDIPVDLNEAVKRLGGLLCEIRIDESQPEATVRKAGERFEISLRHNAIPARKRFSIAHELGHLFLHMGYLRDPETWQKSHDYKDSIYHRFGYGIEEEEANLFAAAFLMPEKEFRVAAQIHPQSQESLKRIAQHFGTSVTAVLRRGQDLGVFRIRTDGQG
jgi:Zn-dependent peptidase ImmA (M78 family)